MFTGAISSSAKVDLKRLRDIFARKLDCMTGGPDERGNLARKGRDLEISSLRSSLAWSRGGGMVVEALVPQAGGCAVG